MKMSIKLWITLIFIFFPAICHANILINEIMYDLEGSDGDREWIEIYNNASTTIDLTGWKFYEAETNHRIKGDLILSGGEYAVIVDKEETFLIDNPNYQGKIFDSSFSLNNKGEYLALKDADLNIIDEITYNPDLGAKGNGKTLSLINNNWIESDSTPGAPNSSGADPEPDPEPPPITSGGSGSPPKNDPPIAKAGSDQTVLTGTEIIFDASESSDPDGDILSFFWNFGDGTTSDQEKVAHIYEFSGQYLVNLTVSDSKLEAFDNLSIYVFSAGLIISEFDPEQGWVEIYNSSEQIINLANYQLNNFVFPKNSLIAPKKYLVIVLESLENPLKLIYPNQEVAQEIIFEEIKKNYSVNRVSDNNYFWSNIKTPGNPNFIKTNSNKIIQIIPVIAKQKTTKTFKNKVLASGVQEPKAKNQSYSPVQAKALYQNSKISDAMGKFILSLSIAISIGLLSSFLLLKYQRRI